jgi:histidine ammonia-lyase
MLAERQLNFLLNHHINGILPPFVNLGELGFNFGVQGAQFTATSTTAENQMLSTSMYIHSIPNNNDNQDIVSMGTNAASATRKVIENAYQVLSVEFMAIVQAIEYLDIEDQLSSYTRQLFQKVKALTPPFAEDEPLYKRTAAVKEFLQTERLNILDRVDVPTTV